jgi:transposase
MVIYLLRRVIQKKFSVVLVDEFRTSKLCSHCNCELEHYNNLHRVLVCRNCKSSGSESKNTTFMNRDMNACMNMLHISKSWIQSKMRPEQFCRTSNPDFSFEEVKRGSSVVFT